MNPVRVICGADELNEDHLVINACMNEVRNTDFNFSWYTTYFN